MGRGHAGQLLAFLRFDMASYVRGSPGMETGIGTIEWQLSTERKQTRGCLSKFLEERYTLQYLNTVHAQYNTVNTTLCKRDKFAWRFVCLPLSG